ncbi:DNA-binding MarR family transcriptional regulator [Arthrobacter pigmenti]|uniref:DNA-binding MarR family transcriptional regulator n=1 Tax=Arthrobacter pigmenti TaxID=271432 RepID=A0A846RRZ0_9MICC|nr:MarR family transcriptional regulator [Arthrobacter pigmenti]NJC23819.1 DNA-binding MarR family transcriptional regulator [Arthrobacter pigmenti]
MADTRLWSSERLLTTAARLVENAWNERLMGIGITHAGFITLRALQTLGTASQTQLADQLHVTAQTVGRTLVRLQQQGLVSREGSPSDRRIFLVRLTDLGNARLKAAEQDERDFMLDLDGAGPGLRNLLIDLIEDLLPGKPVSVGAGEKTIGVEEELRRR